MPLRIRKMVNSVLSEINFNYLRLDFIPYQPTLDNLQGYLHKLNYFRVLSTPKEEYYTLIIVLV